MYDLKTLALLCASLLALLVVVWQPLSRKHDDSDKGTDRLVKLPPFRKPSMRRLWMFCIVGLVVSALIIGLKRPPLLQVYQGTVASLVASVSKDPAAATFYSQHITPLIPAAVVGYLVTLAIVLPASIGRRIMILLHAPLFLAVSAISDALLGLAGNQLHVPVGMTPILSIYIEYFLGFMMVFRLGFTTYALPRVTRQPNRRRGDWRDTVVMIASMVAATGIIAPMALYLINRVGDHPVTEFLIIVSMRTAMADFSYVLLGLVKLAGGRRPQPGPYRPAVDIIIPAFNEEYGIERLLRSIDRAAVHYGGPVHVILCDDGSTDRTNELANATISEFAQATGQVILGKHAGKAKALNQAMTYSTADFVFRLDADCAIDQNSLVYAMPYFADQSIGLVGALTLPKEPYYTWIDRMRAMEQIFNFGFSQVMLAEVDAVPCILGSFTGFRRKAFEDLGGFVHGMFAEDAEFTCAIGRLGWRAAVDPRIISYEDVPPTIQDLRVQRTRWGMGGMMNFARFTPWGAGAGGPRFWFQLTKSAGTRLFSPPHFFIMILALGYAALVPGVQHNLPKFAWFLFVSFLPGLIPRMFMLVYYRRLKILLWSPLWLVFSMLKRTYLLEAALSVGTRPVLPPMAIRGRYPTFASMVGLGGRGSRSSRRGGAPATATPPA